MGIPSTINLHIAPSNSSTNSSNNAAQVSQVMTINQSKNEALKIIIDVAKIGMLTSFSYTGLKYLREYTMNLKPENEADNGIRGFLAKYKNVIDWVTFPITNPSMYSLAITSAYLYFKARKSLT